MLQLYSKRQISLTHKFTHTGLCNNITSSRAHRDRLTCFSAEAYSPSLLSLEFNVSAGINFAVCEAPPRHPARFGSQSTSCNPDTHFAGLWSDVILDDAKWIF